MWPKNNPTRFCVAISDGIDAIYDIWLDLHGMCAINVARLTKKIATTTMPASELSGQLCCLILAAMQV